MHLTKLSLKSCWIKHLVEMVLGIIRLDQKWNGFKASLNTPWQMTVPDFNIKITDAAEDIKRNVPSSCPVPLLTQTILFVCQKITHIGDLTMIMLPISTLWKVEALISFLSHSAKVLAFLYSTKSFPFKFL